MDRISWGEHHLFLFLSHSFILLIEDIMWIMKNVRSDVKKTPYHLTSICWSLRPVHALSLCLLSVFNGIVFFLVWSGLTHLVSLCYVTTRSIQMQMCFMIPEETCEPRTSSDWDFHFPIGCSAVSWGGPDLNFLLLFQSLLDFVSIITGHILKKAGLYHCSGINS